jgi:hypothetical protein
MGGRAVGVLGTLIMTRFLAPEVIGEVADATIICMTANWLTIWGFGQYAVVKGRGDDAKEVTFHAFIGRFPGTSVRDTVRQEMRSPAFPVTEAGAV